MPRFLCTLAFTLALALPVPAGDWPRFHGLNGTGVGDADAPLDWSKVTGGWKVPIPGKGHSSPVVAAGRVFLQSAPDDGSKRTLFCLDAKTGQTIWTSDVLAGKGHTHQKSSLASSTPVVDGDRVIVLFWDGKACGLHAYDVAEGKPLWNISLGAFESDHGAGLSPVVFGGKVFVNYDQGAQKDKPGKAELFAFDVATGAKVWSAPRKGFRACSASPIIRPLPGGKNEVVVASTAGLTGYDPDTGAVHWDWTWKFDGLPLRTIAGPVLVNGTVVAFSGDGGGGRSAVAVTPGSAPKLVWEKKKGTPYVPSAVVKGEHIYWLTDDGQAVCAEAKTGDEVWKERVFAKAVTASTVLAGDKVLAVAEDGKAVVFKATPEGFEKVADMNVGEGVFASPAVADGRVYVRGFTHLYCFAAK